MFIRMFQHSKCVSSLGFPYKTWMGQPSMSSCRFCASFVSEQHLVLLTDQYSQPKQHAQECVQRVWIKARSSVRSLGYEQEKVPLFCRRALRRGRFENRNRTLILNAFVKTSQQTSFIPAPWASPTRLYTDKATQSMITKREYAGDFVLYEYWTGDTCGHLRCRCVKCGKCVMASA